MRFKVLFQKLIMTENTYLNCTHGSLNITKLNNFFTLQ